MANQVVKIKWIYVRTCSRDFSSADAYDRYSLGWACFWRDYGISLNRYRVESNLIFRSGCTCALTVFQVPTWRVSYANCTCAQGFFRVFSFTFLCVSSRRPLRVIPSLLRHAPLYFSLQAIAPFSCFSERQHDTTVYVSHEGSRVFTFAIPTKGFKPTLTLPSSLASASVSSPGASANVRLLSDDYLLSSYHRRYSQYLPQVIHPRLCNHIFEETARQLKAFAGRPVTMGPFSGAIIDTVLHDCISSHHRSPVRFVQLSVSTALPLPLLGPPGRWTH